MVDTAVIAESSSSSLSRISARRSKSSHICSLASALIAANGNPTKQAKHTSIFSGAQSVRPLSKRRSEPPYGHQNTNTVAQLQLSFKPSLPLNPMEALVACSSQKPKLSIDRLEANLEASSRKKEALFTKLDASMASKETIVDSRTLLHPEQAVSNGPKVSQEDLRHIQNHMASITDYRSNAELDRIIEKADIYFAVQVLVRQLIIQAEDQARDVLKLIKERKKNIDALGDLAGAFTLAKGDIDYSKDGHMRDLIDRAVECGVPIAPGKYDFTQSERDDLMKIIDSKKASIESFNQTEMVTLQEKQSRFNSLQEMLTHLMKQLEHVMRTIVGNVRPG